MAAVDIAVLALVAAAALRGLFLGLVRESFSLASLVAAVLAVRFGAVPGGAWLRGRWLADWEPFAAEVAAGAALALAVLVAGALLGRTIRRGAHAVGLGWLDRTAGGLLGAGEGALIAGVLLALMAAFAGRDHPVLTKSQAFAAFEQAETALREGELPRVAAPPPD